MNKMWKNKRGGGGGIVFSGGQEVKIFITVLGEFGKNMVDKKYF